VLQFSGTSATLNHRLSENQGDASARSMHLRMTFQANRWTDRVLLGHSQRGAILCDWLVSWLLDPTERQEIHVTSTDAFALKNSDLNAFLFAEVGTELNGSALTILSVLARLGQDPWAEAARWAKMPKAAAIDSLAQSIGKMPLSSQALAETLQPPHR
jgi:hypothetical protein